MSIWTRRVSTGQWLFWNALLSLPAVALMLFNSRLWWVGALIVLFLLIRVLRHSVLQRQRRERERALLERLSK